jgi:N,N'-diacetyllegionaminate synthase
MKKINKVFIIAEAGVNHNGKIKLAKKLIEKSKEAGADAIKFQLYSTDEIASTGLKLAAYQKKNTDNSDNQYDMLKKYEISLDFVREIKRHCKKINIDFMVSVFDNKSLNILNKINYKNFIKIPSGELNNYFLLRSIKNSKYKLILSTGMSNFEDIVNSINFISKRKIFSYKKKNDTIQIINKKFHASLKKKIHLLHCVTDYPAPSKFLNLNVISEIKNLTKLNIGFSDHSEGIDASVYAVFCGARIIEKHITLDRNLSGPDHKASLNPQLFKLMVSKIRAAENILGSYKKKIQFCEIKNIKSVRKVVVAKKIIKKGKKFTWNNLSSKRTGLEGIDIKDVIKLIGKKAIKDYIKNQIIKI